MECDESGEETTVVFIPPLLFANALAFPGLCEAGDELLAELAFVFAVIFADCRDERGGEDLSSELVRLSSL